MVSALHLVDTLLDDQVVHRDQAGGLETQRREHEVDAIQAKCEIVLQQRQIRVAQARPIPNNEGTLAAVTVTQGRQSIQALAPPGVQVDTAQVRQSSAKTGNLRGECPARQVGQGASGSA